MINTDELISAAESLPLDLKTELIERLIKSLNPCQEDQEDQEDIDKLWGEEAERRVEELKTGKVKPIPGEEVFREIRESLLR